MSTSALIGVQTEHGQVRSVYVHSDGYPEYVGRILQDHYTDPEKIAQLIELGDLSLLAPEIGEQHSFDERHRNPHGEYKNWCCAYGRDRGEKDTEADVFDSVDDWVNMSEYMSYLYLWNGERWLVADCNIGWNTGTIDDFRPM